MYVNPFWLGFLVGFVVAITLVLVIGSAAKGGGE